MGTLAWMIIVFIIGLAGGAVGYWYLQKLINKGKVKV